MLPVADSDWSFLDEDPPLSATGSVQEPSPVAVELEDAAHGEDETIAEVVEEEVEGLADAPVIEASKNSEPPAAARSSNLFDDLFGEDDLSLDLDGDLDLAFDDLTVGLDSDDKPEEVAIEASAGIEFTVELDAEEDVKS